ncbi:MAG: DNA polymerase III subunit delta [Lachnospiraceae bacterium]|nr:DNA polymerase III subunit delta [Lachnospiraceae bacterium]
MQKIKADLKARHFEKIYLFFGKESYLCRAYKKQFIKAIVNEGDDMNYSYFENAIDKLLEIENIADTMPFFADRRLVVLENSGLFKKENDFADYIPSIPDTTTIILIDSEVDKRSRLYKAISKNGYACEFNRQSPAELRDFVCRWVRLAGKQLSTGLADLLISTVGDDMNTIVNEADKVIAYCGEREVITKDDIEAMCTPLAEAKVFDLVDALITRNKSKSFEIYADLLAMRESGFGILALIRKNYQRLLSVRELEDQDLGISEIAGRIQAQDWLVRKMKTQIRGYSPKKLQRAVEETVNTEYAIKTGDIGEQLGLEILLANLLNI